MSEQGIFSNPQARNTNTSGQMSTQYADEGKKRREGGDPPSGNYATSGDSTSSGNFGSSINIDYGAAGRGNLDPDTAGTFNAHSTEDEGGIRDLKQVEHVSEVRPTTQIGL